MKIVNEISRFSPDQHKCSRKFSAVIHWSYNCLLAITDSQLLHSAPLILGKRSVTWFYFPHPLLVRYAVVFILHASLREDETNKLPTTREREVEELVLRHLRGKPLLLSRMYLLTRMTSKLICRCAGAIVFCRFCHFKKIVVKGVQTSCTECAHL